MKEHLSGGGDRPGAGSPVPAARHALARPAAARASRAAYAVVLAAMAGGLALATLAGGEVRAGSVTVACALLAAAVARLILPEASAGLLVSRRRLADVLVLATLGTCILIAALVLPSPS